MTNQNMSIDDNETSAAEPDATNWPAPRPMPLQRRIRPPTIFHPATSLGPRCAIATLAVAGASVPRMGSNLSRKPFDHRPSCNVSGPGVRNCDPPIGDFFQKPESRSDWKHLATAWRWELFLGPCLLLGATGKVSAWGESFAVWTLVRHAAITQYSRQTRAQVRA
jgi:hypothetical protein